MILRLLWWTTSHKMSTNSGILFARRISYQRCVNNRFHYLFIWKCTIVNVRRLLVLYIVYASSRSKRIVNVIILFLFCCFSFIFFTVHVQYLLQIVLVSNGSGHGSCMFLKVRENIWYCQSMFSFYELEWLSVTLMSWCYVNQSCLSARQT